MIYTLHGFAGRVDQFNFIKKAHKDIDLFNIEPLNLNQIYKRLNQHKNIVLVGYSMGARLAARLFVQNPEQYSAIHLISGHMGFELETQRQERIKTETVFMQNLNLLDENDFMAYWNGLDLFEHDQPEKIRYHKEKLFTMIENFRLSQQEFLLPKLSPYKERVFFYYGNKDNKYFNYAKKELSDFNVDFLENAGHRLYQYKNFQNLLNDRLL